MPRSIHAGAFQKFINSVYGTPQAMAVAAPMAIQGVPRNLFRWGEFEKRAVPHRGLWPEVALPTTTINTFDSFQHHCDHLRASLSASRNADALSPDEPNTIPATRLDLLDEAVRKAFYSAPPIPFEVDVLDAPGADHEVRIDWDLDPTGRPVLLKVKILCPALPAGRP